MPRRLTLSFSCPDATGIVAEIAGFVARHRGSIAEASQHLPQQFPAGSGPESGAKTDAKPEIWSDAAGFAAAAKALQDESAKLVALVDAGDAAGARTQAGAVGQSCGGCHQKYRVKHD